jgi:hypothetical protein
MRVWSNTIAACTMYNEINEGSPGDFSQGIEGPWSLNLLFCRRGFGLVVSVVVPLMLAVLPYARGRGFDLTNGCLIQLATQVYSACHQCYVANRLFIGSCPFTFCQYSMAFVGSPFSGFVISLYVVLPCRH